MASSVELGSNIVATAFYPLLLSYPVNLFIESIVHGGSQSANVCVDKSVMKAKDVLLTIPLQKFPAIQINIFLFIENCMIAIN